MRRPAVRAVRQAERAAGLFEKAAVALDASSDALEATARRIDSEIESFQAAIIDRMAAANEIRDEVRRNGALRVKLREFAR